MRPTRLLLALPLLSGLAQARPVPAPNPEDTEVSIIDNDNNAATQNQPSTEDEAQETAANDNDTDKQEANIEITTEATDSDAPPPPIELILPDSDSTTEPSSTDESTESTESTDESTSAPKTKKKGWRTKHTLAVLGGTLLLAASVIGGALALSTNGRSADSVMNDALRPMLMHPKTKMPPIPGFWMASDPTNPNLSRAQRARLLG